MEYKFIRFIPATGQLYVQFGEQPAVVVDVPVEGGKFLSGEALHVYVRGFIPTWHMERLNGLRDSPPSNAEEIVSLCAEGEHALPVPTYAELRARAYPAFTDYMDGLVKGDTAQQQAYIDRCLEVKAMFPKPQDEVSEAVLRERLGS